MSAISSTAIIPLTKGKHAIVDIEDYERLSKLKWCVFDCGVHKYYAHRRDLQRYPRYVTMAASIMGRRPEGKFIDHINGNSLDNRRCNLRWATPSQNAANRGKPSGKYTSKFIGVHKLRGKWYATISIKKRTLLVGKFTDETEAARARDAVALKHHSEFARLNFPELRD